MASPSIIIAPNKDTENRQRIANAMMAQSVGTQPVGHWTQALARMAQAYAGKSITEDLEGQKADRESAARGTLIDAMADYRGDKPNYSAQGPQRPATGTGTDRAAMIQTLQGNPDTADLVNQSELARVLAGAPDPKIPSGYQKSAGGGVEQIPGWINSSRYKQVSYVDEQGNTQNAVIDVAQLQGSGASTPMGGQQAPQAQPGQPTVGPNGVINLGQKSPAQMPAEKAGKVALLQQGMKDIADANSLLFNEDGSFDRVNAANAWFNTPYTEGRDIRGRYKTALSGKIYVTTGAVAGPDEISDNMDAFMPGPFDNNNTARDKAVRLNEFLNTALLRMDESGRLVPEDADLAAWMKNSQRKAREYKSLPRPQTDAEYQALPKGSTFIDPDDNQRYIK